MSRPVGPPDDDFSTSESLLERARHGEALAWVHIAALYEPLVRRWCWRLGITDGRVQDIWQEVFVALMTHLGRFDRRRGGAFRAWLRSVTWNKVADLRRQEARLPLGKHDDICEQLVCLPAAAPSTDDAEEVGILYRRALELLRRDFASRTWVAFWGVVVDGRTPADVAAELGLTRNAVFQAKARVLQRLREEFQDYISD